MTKYVTILPYEVMDMVMKGREIFMLDKKAKEVQRVNDMPVYGLAVVLLTEDSRLRYDFWYEEEETADAEF